MRAEAEQNPPTRVLTEREEIELLLERVARLEETCQRLRQAFLEWRNDNK